MWPTRQNRCDEIFHELENFSNARRNLPGIDASANARRTLASQMVASIRRLEFTQILRSRDIHPDRADPRSKSFDAERAAIWHIRNGNLEEAIWLTFLCTHFGKHPSYGWRRLQDVYAGSGGLIWSWDRISQNVDDFESWFRDNEENIGGAFGNHRKYESIRTDSDRGTVAVVRSYINWVGVGGSQVACFSTLVRDGGNDPAVLFERFFSEFSIHRFGRLGKFDFLSLVGRLGLAPIEPGIAYLRNATGPLRGARLLFCGDIDADIEEEILENWLCELDEDLTVGMQVMEDALCNWQKSPEVFVHFRG